MARPKIKEAFSPERFKQARKHAKKTMKDIDKEAGIPLDTQKKASQHGEITPETLDKIAYFLNVSPAYLRGEETIKREEMAADSTGRVMIPYLDFDDHGDLIEVYYDRHEKAERKEKRSQARKLLEVYLSMIGELGVTDPDAEISEIITFTDLPDYVVNVIEYDIERSLLKNIKRRGVK